MSKIQERANTINGEFIVEECLSLVPKDPKVVSVGNTSTKVVDSNFIRAGLILVNISANNISLGFGVAAVVGSGITLLANGGTYNMGELDFYSGNIFGISSVAGSLLTVQEFSRPINS